jgi:phenylalanyl-tRNA synthetase alpha chain
MDCGITGKISSIMEEARQALASAKDARAAEDIKARIIGRKGSLSLLSSEMGSLSPEMRKEAGMAFNKARAEMQNLLDETAQRLSSAASSSSGRLDLTLPGRKWHAGTKHPVSIIIDECVSIFRKMGFTPAGGPEIDTVFNNFDALNTPHDHPSRDVKDTFYFSDGRLLRTHTSPVQIRTMISQKPPVRVVAPGRCFRRDTPDATHSANFHQIEGLYIDKNVSLSDLKSVLLVFARELLGKNVSIRLRPHFFPFTEPSVEYDFSCIMCGGSGCRVCKNSGWIEIAGAGMVHPNVLKNVGYDPETCGGFAFGLGIERIAMIRHRIPDIRALYENDVRFLKQF